jgi:GreA/GreB family transcription elongation factor
VGERVRVLDVASGEWLDLELVGPLEADPSAGRISGPPRKAIGGLRRGATVDVDAPRGTRRFEMLAVEPPARAASTPYGWISPRRIAYRVSSTRSLIPSLSRMFWRCRSTVLTLITSSWAISFEV